MSHKIFPFKVRIFGEGNKIWWNLQILFEITIKIASQKGLDFVIFLWPSQNIHMNFTSPIVLIFWLRLLFCGSVDHIIPFLFFDEPSVLFRKLLSPDIFFSFFFRVPLLSLYQASRPLCFRYVVFIISFLSLFLSKPTHPLTDQNVQS